MDDAGDIATALRGTALQGHPVQEGLGSTFLVEEVDPARLLEAWRAAHAAMPVTGRWPVFTLPGDLYHEPDPAELAELDRAARTLDPWSVYRRRSGDVVQEREDVERYVQAFLGPDMVAPALQQLPSPTTSTILQRWTYDTLLTDAELASRAFTGYEHLVGTNSWHTWPEVQLVLLPTMSQWLAPAWVPYFGQPARTAIRRGLRHCGSGSSGGAPVWSPHGEPCCSSPHHAGRSPARRHGNWPGN